MNTWTKILNDDFRPSAGEGIGNHKAPYVVRGPYGPNSPASGISGRRVPYELWAQMTPGERAAVRRCLGTNKTGFTGVKFSARSKKFEAYLRRPGDLKKIYCGAAKTAAGAARLYDRKLRELFGPQSLGNFPAEA